MKKLIDFIFFPLRNPRYEEIKKYGIQDALQISLIVCPPLIFAVLLFLIMSYVWPESYSNEGLLGAYRASYFNILIGLCIYEIILLFFKKKFERHYLKVPYINLVATFVLLWWGCRMTSLDYASYGRVDVTLFSMLTFCIPFCLYLDVRVYMALIVPADAYVVIIMLFDGIEVAFNKNNLGDFMVFIGIQIVLGIVSFYFKYAMREQILEKEERQEEIRQLNESQSRFFSNMSHEIRTPINTIIGLNEMILREDISEEIKEDAKNIQSASNMLLRLINDILDMSKIESGQMQLTDVDYSVRDMLADIVGMMRVRANEKKLEFRVEIEPDVPSMLYGDEVRIKQVIINVINNAIKYTKEGYVRFSIGCERDGNGNAKMSFSITDTGMGIKKESIPHLFNAFKRIDEEKNRYIEGTGLGLAIVKQFVDLMGGRITVNSVYTKGSTFVIEIPQRIVNDEKIGVVDIERINRKNNDYSYMESFDAPDARILVVDDTETNLMVARKLLKSTKMKVDTVMSGKEALEKTLNEDYHVILMDHMMPEMDGIECMHAIKNQVGGHCRESKIIALTANVGRDAEIMYENEGFDGYLSKPFTGEKLESAIYKLLPKTLVTVVGSAKNLKEASMAWITSGRKKTGIKITTESVADIPTELIKKYNIAVIPHKVRTDYGVFKDDLEIETNGLLAYMKKDDVVVETIPPTVSEHEEFFSNQLDEGNSIIHISISSRLLNSGCAMAMEAALDFGNVHVVDSGHLSSGQGIMAVKAAKMVAKGLPVDDIISEITSLKEKIHTSFVVDTLAFLVRQKQISSYKAHLASVFMLHPVVGLKKGKMGIIRYYFGSRERAWKKYISTVLKNPRVIDKKVLFITYVGMNTKELETVKELVEKKVKFDEVYFQKASPAIAANSGPGTFGLLFCMK